MGDDRIAKITVDRAKRIATQVRRLEGLPYNSDKARQFAAPGFSGFWAKVTDFERDTDDPSIVYFAWTELQLTSTGWGEKTGGRSGTVDDDYAINVIPEIPLRGQRVWMSFGYADASSEQTGEYRFMCPAPEVFLKISGSSTLSANLYGYTYSEVVLNSGGVGTWKALTGGPASGDGGSLLLVNGCENANAASGAQSSANGFDITSYVAAGVPMRPLGIGAVVRAKLSTDCDNVQVWVASQTTLPKITC